MITNEAFAWVGPAVFAIVMFATFSFVVFLRWLYEQSDKVKRINEDLEEEFQRLHEWREPKPDKRDVVTALLAQREQLNTKIAEAIREQNDGTDSETSPYRNDV